MSGSASIYKSSSSYINAVSQLWLPNNSYNLLHIFPLQAPICWSAWTPVSVCTSTGTPRRCAVCPAGEATSSRVWAGTSCWATRPAQDPSWLARVKALFLRQRSLRMRAACLTPIQINTLDRWESDYVCYLAHDSHICFVSFNCSNCIISIYI